MCSAEGGVQPAVGWVWSGSVWQCPHPPRDIADFVSDSFVVRVCAGGVAYLTCVHSTPLVSQYQSGGGEEQGKLRGEGVRNQLSRGVYPTQNTKGERGDRTIS